MAIFAIGDLHLGQAVNKPMDIFGSDWENHPERIAQAWRQMIDSEDVVLLPGDLSWAMTLDEAKPDLEWIGQLPGYKLLIRGNHDYWWNGISKVRAALPQKCWAIQNDAVALAGYAFCGTRGWVLPSHPKFTDHDLVIYRREGERLRLSLEQAEKYGLPKIVAMHYPPCSSEGEDTLFTQLLEKYSVQVCVYGHLHGPSHRFAFEGTRGGVTYRLVSADYLAFRPLQIQ
jgi:predicted phosphohydrolase